MSYLKRLLDDFDIIKLKYDEKNKECLDLKLKVKILERSLKKIKYDRGITSGQTNANNYILAMKTLARL